MTMDANKSPAEQFAHKARGQLRTLRAASDCVSSCALVSYDGLVLAVAADPTKSLGKLILDTRTTASALASLQLGGMAA